MEGFSYKDYLSYFTFRYGSKEMREIFSLHNLRITWRKIWAALAKAQMKLGLLSKAEYEEIEKNKANLNLEKSFALENELQHDLMAELKVYASQCPKGGGKIHLGATSTDILDNAEILCFKKALNLIKDKLILLLKKFVEFVENYKDLVCMGFTHLQSAEPTTLGYRFSFYLQDLYLDLLLLKFLEKEIKAKGIKGAVGTSASFVNLFEGDFEKTEILEKKVIQELNLEAFLITSQTYPRKIDFWILNFLASLSQSLHKFAFDLRIMQSLGELQEPFLKYQVGSSAMPFKKNPILAERICSLAEYIKVLPQVAWNNASDTLLERTLDDSANRRIIMSEAFLSLDEILILAEKIISKVKINQFNINKNLETFGPFSALEPLMLALVKKGANRQEMHEIFRKISLKAKDKIDQGRVNSLKDLILKEEKITSLMGIKEIENAMDCKKHIGLAKINSEKMLLEVKKCLEL